MDVFKSLGLSSLKFNGLEELFKQLTPLLTSQ